MVPPLFPLPYIVITPDLMNPFIKEANQQPTKNVIKLKIIMRKGTFNEILISPNLQATYFASANILFPFPFLTALPISSLSI